MIGLKRLKAYGIMTGTEPRPRLTSGTAPLVTDSDLTDALAQVQAASVRFTAAQRAFNETPDDATVASEFSQAQTELLRTTRTVPTVTLPQSAPSGTAESTEDWDQRHEKAFHMLIMSLSEEFKTHTIDCEDLPSIWTCLSLRFEEKAAADILAAQAELERLSLSDTDSIMDFLDRIRLIRRTLANSGSPIDDKTLFQKILRKLPAKMNALHDTILYGPPARATYDILEQTLISYHKNNS